MRIYKEQTGITTVIVAVLLAVILVAGAAGYNVYQNKSSKPVSTSSVVSSPVPDSTIPVPDSTSKPKPVPDSGKATGMLSGQVTCTQKIDPKPCATQIEIENMATNPASGSYMQPIVVDASGKFSIELIAGSYKLTPNKKPEYPMFVPPLINPVEIKAGQTTTITINYHDGTR